MVRPLNWVLKPSLRRKIKIIAPEASFIICLPALFPYPHDAEEDTLLSQVAIRNRSLLGKLYSRRILGLSQTKFGHQLLGMCVNI